MVSRTDRLALSPGGGKVDIDVRFTPRGVVQGCIGSKSKARLVEASCRLLRERGWFGSTRARNAAGAEKVRFNWSPPEPTVPDPSVMFDGGAGGISPQFWFRGDDYPRDALERDEKGTTVVDLDISELGAITNCTVARSSGSETLDAATCRIILARGRYFPAGDGAGGRKATRARIPMRWLRY